jgi:diguanylate cyclase (GGDEF)-like protein
VGGIWIFSDGRPFDSDERQHAELVIAQAELALINSERFLQAREKAFIDDVTSLYNARYLLSALDREVNRAVRSQSCLSVLFLDLDRFKTVNDRFGHLVGSRVLREIGVLLQESVRAIDTVGRYGGDEFTILLVDTSLDGALSVADRIRRSIAGHIFSGERGLDLRLTISIGVASYPGHGDSRERLLDLADKAMYLAKALGRDHICSADELSQSRA